MASCGSNINVPEKTIPISKDASWNNAYHIMDKLMNSELGFKDYQAAGIVGNIFAESRWNPTTVNPNDRGMESIGLCQWRAKRNTKLKEKANETNKSWTDLDLQVDYLIEELKGTKNESLNAILTQSTVEDAANIFCCKFEVAGECYNKDCSKRPTNRIGYSKDFLSKWRARNK